MTRNEEEIYEALDRLEILGFRVTVGKYGDKYSVTLWRKDCFSSGFYSWLSFEGTEEQVDALVKAIWLAHYLGYEEASRYYKEFVWEWTRRNVSVYEEEPCDKQKGRKK
jgi:hypothetical protein